MWNDTNGALYPFLLLLGAHIGLVHGVDVGAYILEASVTQIIDFVLITLHYILFGSLVLL